jgi:hypothetical protein
LSSFIVDFPTCNPNDKLQKWEIGYKNMKALNNWEEYGEKL